MGEDYFAKARKITENLEEKNQVKHGELLGYTISHTYRAKNTFGALVLETKDFDVNVEMTEVF